MKRLISILLAAALLFAAAMPVRAQELTPADDALLLNELLAEQEANPAEEPPLNGAELELLPPEALELALPLPEDISSLENPEAAEETEEESSTDESEPAEDAAATMKATALTADLKTADVSMYPTITLAGGSHALFLNEGTPEQEVVYNPANTGGIVKEYITPVIKSLLKFDIDGVVDSIVEVLWRTFGPVAMDENGESITDGITCNRHTYYTSNINSNEIFFGFDWRQDPMKTADDLKEFMEYVRTKRGPVEKFNLVGTSGSGSVVLAYMQQHGYDDLASLVMNISLHNGIEMFGALAKGEVALGAEATGKLDADLSNLGVNLRLQPWLRILYETGLLSVLSKTTKSGIRPWVRRTYVEAVIPLIFMMPGYWTFVPPEDYEAAKAYLFRENPTKYAGLIAKIDRYHNDVAMKSDAIILEASKHFKVAIRAGYGKPSWPLGEDTGVQSDGMVETFRASLGATGSPVDEPFPYWYKQKIDDGHNRISPDRYVDASTCLLPEQTWFSYKMSHTWEISYSGWYEWWLKTDNPTVDNEKFPQFSEMTEPKVFVTREAEPQTKAVSLLKSIGLWILKAWRWLLLLPLFWVKWWYQKYI